MRLALPVGLAIVLLGGAPCASAAGTQPANGEVATKPLPREVRVFIERREGCDHFRGEPVPEPADDPKGERRRQIESALAKLCTGTDAELARLRARYRDDAAVTAALADFEDDIE
jgi:hypothetical protein